MRTLVGTQWSASRSVIMTIIRLESRLALPSAGVNAAEDRSPRRFRTLLGKNSASPTCWGRARGGAAICCSMGCLGASGDPSLGHSSGLEVQSPGRFRTLPGKTSASPICWGCPGASGDPLLGPSRGFEVRGPGRFRTLPGKTSASPTCWGCSCGSGGPCSSSSAGTSSTSR